MSFLSELKRRNVLRVGAAYIVMGWLVVQVVETLFPIYGLSDGAIRLVVNMLVVCLVPMLVLAWVFEWTPEGLKRDAEVEPEAPSSLAAAKRLDRIIIVVLALALGYFAFDKFVLAPERAAEREAEVAERAEAEAITGYYGDRSIAVLPFDNMSADPEQQYLVDGVAEELLNLLARIRQLRVISRSSSFALRDLDLEVPAIAERLGVGHILEGSVRKSGNTVRVTVQLIECRTDTHLWSKTYERSLEDLFAIQDEIAIDVVNNLKIELLSPLPTSRMIDPETIALTQQAKQLVQRQSRDVGERMSLLIERAIEVDPNYVAAWKWKTYADYYLMLAGQISAEEFDQRYLESHSRILELDPESGIVDAHNAFDAMMAGEYENAASLFERSLSKEVSNSEAVRTAAVFARTIGKIETSIRLDEHAIAIDPLCYLCLYQLSRSNMYAGRYDAAVEMRHRYLAITESGGEFQYGLMLLLQGKAGDALAQFQSIEPDNPGAQAGLAMAYYELGDSGKAESALFRLMATERPQFEVHVAEAAAWMGKSDLAFEWLQKARETTPPARMRLLNPAFRNLHDDPRWDEFRESVGFSHERLDAISFNPELPN